MPASPITITRCGGICSYGATQIFVREAPTQSFQHSKSAAGYQSKKKRAVREHQPASFFEQSNVDALKGP